MKILVPALALLAAVVSGCTGEAKAKVPTEPMGPDAPMFGSTPETSTVAGFITGRWSPVISSMGMDVDPEFAKQLGVEVLDNPNEVEVIVGKFWEFAPEGTFFYSEDRVKWKIHGTWVAAGNGVRLTYERKDDQTLTEAKAELRRLAETGQPAAIAGELKMDNVFADLAQMTYFEVHKDQKRLHFKAEGATPGSMQTLISASSTLMRMGWGED